MAALLAAWQSPVVAADVKEAGQFAIKGFVVEGNTLLPETVVNSAVAPFAGDAKGMQDITKAAETLRHVYEEAGFPVVQVFAPEQTLNTGTVTLKVLEGSVNSVILKGNQTYSEANILQSLPSLKAKAKPNVKQIIAEIAAANENPAKQLAVNFQAAEQPGMIDAVVNVTEDRPEKYTLSADNMGSPSTGVNRYTLGYQNANLFNKDHMLTLSAGTSFDTPQKSLNVSGGYRIPFYGTGLSLDLMASYSDSSATTNPGVAGGNSTTQFAGKGIMLGARVNHSLPSVGEYRHKLVYGLDYKDFDNTCKGNAFVPGTIGAKCSTVTSQPLSLTYFGQLAKPEYQLSGSASFVTNLPGGPNGGNKEYAAAGQSTNPNVHASPDWYAWRFNANLGVPLPNDFQFRSAFAGQLTGTRLIAGEQFGLGGANSVRGYMERTATGDNGYSANVELYSPELGKYVYDKIGLRVLAFYDFGRTYIVRPE